MEGGGHIHLRLDVKYKYSPVLHTVSLLYSLHPEIILIII